MNPEQNDPLQTQDNQQDYQSPASPPTPASPETFGSEQQPIAPPTVSPQTFGSEQPPLPSQPPQTNKFPQAIVGGVVVLIGVAFGIFMLLSGGNKIELSNQTSQETTQEAVVENSESSAQADTQHKDNLEKFAVAISNYSADNNGMLPASSEIDNTFIAQYMGKFNDPSTDSQYKIVESDPKFGEVQYKTSSACSSDNAIVAGSSRQAAARVMLSDKTYFCVIN